MTREQLVSRTIRTQGLNDRTIITVDFSGAGLRLTADGEVVLLGHVHHFLRRSIVQGELHPHESDYSWDGDELTFAVRRRDARQVAGTLLTLLSRRGATE